MGSQKWPRPRPACSSFYRGTPTSRFPWRSSPNTLEIKIKNKVFGYDNKKKKKISLSSLGPKIVSTQKIKAYSMNYRRVQSNFGGAELFFNTNNKTLISII